MGRCPGFAADQSGLFAVEGDEPYGGLEIVQGSDARRFEQAGYPAGIVVRTRIVHRVVVSAHDVILARTQLAGKRGGDVVVSGVLVRKRLQGDCQPEPREGIHDILPRRVVLRACAPRLSPAA